MLSARNFNRVLATTVTLLLVLVGTARAAGLDLIPQKIDSGISPACVDSIAKASGATFQCNWDTTTESVGGHATEANAYDSSNNMSAFSAAVSFTTDDLPTWPAAPTDLTAVCNANNTQATLSWSGVNGATLYAVRVNYKANDGGPGCIDGWYCSDPPDKVVNNNPGTSYIAAVTPNQPYAFWVHGLKDSAFGDANSGIFVCGTGTPSLTVASSNPSIGASITVSPSDNNSQGNGVTQFTRTYNTNTAVTLIAAPIAGGNNFITWTGCDSTSGGGGTICNMAVTANKTVTAVYGACSITAIAMGTQVNGSLTDDD